MFVYFVRAGNRGAIKVGIAVNVDRRIATLQTGNAFKLNLMALIPCSCRKEAERLEGSIHRFFRKQRIRGEWFQGNIDFKKITGVVDYGNTEASKGQKKSSYTHVKNAKKKRRANKLKALA